MGGIRLAFHNMKYPDLYTERIENTMKDYKCIMVKNHEEISNVIDDYQGKGWQLHTYQTVGSWSFIMSYSINHYLLFERKM